MRVGVEALWRLDAAELDRANGETVEAKDQRGDSDVSLIELRLIILLVPSDGKVALSEVSEMPIACDEDASSRRRFWCCFVERW